MNISSLLAFSGVLLLAILLAACTPTSSTQMAVEPTPTEIPVEPVASAPTEAASDTSGAEEAPAEPATAVPAPTEPPAPTPTEASVVDQNAAPPQSAAPGPNDDFLPSNPNNVQLAAGYPQLVEFFAYW